MSEDNLSIKDDLLRGKGVGAEPGPIFPFEKPTKISLIPNTILKNVDIYLRPVIYKATVNRDVDVVGILKNTQEMFHNGRNHYDKDFWIQHCAASFREILMFVDPSHFNDAYLNIPDTSHPEIQKAFIFLVDAVSYLSSVVHLRTDKLMGDAEKLYPKQGFGQMKKEDFIKQGDIFLERLCIDVIYTLDFIFSKYCTNGK